MSLDVRMVARCDCCEAEVPVRLFLEADGFQSFPNPRWTPDGVSLDGWQLPSSSRTPKEVRCPRCHAAEVAL